MNALDWTEKYRPQTLPDVIGNGNAIRQLMDWAKLWQSGVPASEKAILIHGPAGVGKTTVAHALARDLGWEAVELNASDQRTAEIIGKIGGAASRLGTFEGIRGRRLLILDEADNIHGTADRGGERALVDVIKNTGQPIILIANELYNISAGLRNACKTVNFSSVQSRSIVPALKKICHAEGINPAPGVLEAIAEKSNGDLRSAINDLQAIGQGKDKIELSDVITGERDSRETIFKFIAKVFKGTHPLESVRDSYTLDESPEDIIHWIDENLPIEYKEPEDLYRGFESVSRADIFLGRVKIKMNYGMWRYAGFLMIAGVVVAKSHKYGGFTKYQPPSVWRKLGQTKGIRGIRDSIAGKIGKYCHTSQRFARAELITFLKYLITDKQHAPYAAALLKLDVEEIAFLLDSKSATKTVKKIYDDAQEIIKKEMAHDIEIYGRFKEPPAFQPEVKPQMQEPQRQESVESGSTGKVDENDKVKGKKPGKKPQSKKLDNKPQSTLFDF